MARQRVWGGFINAHCVSGANAIAARRLLVASYLALST